MRSLNATFLRNHIVSALRASSDPDVRHAASLIDQNIVYAHPTITQLAASIASIISTKATGSRSSQQAGLIEDFIAKYAANLPTIRSTSEVPKEGIVVFLTGSTGSIGSYILAGLLADTRVAKVYAFNRPSKAATDRHLSSFEDRELPTELLSGHKYVSLEGDLNLPSFGLSDNIYKEVRHTESCFSRTSLMLVVDHLFCHAYCAQCVESRLQPRSKLLREPDCRYQETPRYMRIF